MDSHDDTNDEQSDEYYQTDDHSYGDSSRSRQSYGGGSYSDDEYNDHMNDEDRYGYDSDNTYEYNSDGHRQYYKERCCKERLCYRKGCCEERPCYRKKCCKRDPCHRKGCRNAWCEIEDKCDIENKCERKRYHHPYYPRRHHKRCCKKDPCRKEHCPNPWCYKKGRKHCGEPRYCKDKSWPPPRSPKWGCDLKSGEIRANELIADVVKSAPEKLYVPSAMFPTLDNALRYLNLQDEKRSTTGFHIILRHGSHYVRYDHNLSIHNLIIEAESWHPTMANPYFVGHGHSHYAIPDFVDYYNKEIGGLGEYKIETAGRRITVCSLGGGNRRGYNPDFSDLRCGDRLNWRNKDGRIICYTIRVARCNSIWINECFDRCQPCVGEGFWVSNRSSIQFCGQRQLQVASNGSLDYRGLHLNVVGNRCRDQDINLITGSSNGSTQFIHSYIERGTVLIGDISDLYPCIFKSGLRLTPGSSGLCLYHGFINRLARVELDQSLVTFAGSLAVGADEALISIGSAAGSFIAGTMHDCKVAVNVLGGTFNYIGTVFSNNREAAILCQAGRIFSTTNEYMDLRAPFFRDNDRALVMKNKSFGWSNQLVTFGNSVDLVIDDIVYNALSDYPSEKFEQFASTLRYTEHVRQD
jgi:hypothetical protein